MYRHDIVTELGPPKHDCEVRERGHGSDSQDDVGVDGGAVDFRSDKERTAAYTKAAKKQTKEQTRLMRQQAAQQAAHTRAVEQAQVAQQQAAQQPTAPGPSPTPQLPPAGWYPDQADASLVRWFDGTQWTDFTQPRG